MVTEVPLELAGNCRNGVAEEVLPTFRVEPLGGLHQPDVGNLLEVVVRFAPAAVAVRQCLCDTGIDHGDLVSDLPLSVGTGCQLRLAKQFGGSLTSIRGEVNTHGLARSSSDTDVALC